MDPSHLKRDPQRVLSTLSLTKTKELVTSKGCRIHIPQKYQNNKLAILGDEIYILGIFGLILENKYYAVSNVPGLVRIVPDDILEVKIGEVGYLEFVFDPNSVVMDTVEVVKDNQLPYLVYNEFIAKGSIPWYIGYHDLADLFKYAKPYANLNVGANHAVMEMIVAMIAHDPANLKDYYRHTVPNLQAVETNPPTIIKVEDVTYSATNTTAKLIGGYWNEGIVSALVNPSEKVEPIERLLRK